MKALIMAGGKGTRLLPYSATLPKPLMPIGEQPILEILLLKLKSAGVDHCILAVNHMRHLIEAYFGDGERFKLPVSYSFEDKPLGTAGPIGAALDRLGDNFIISNGDLLTTLNIKKMIQFHHFSGADVTIGSYRRDIKSDFGVLEVDDEMQLIDYIEKPTTSHLVSMGIYIMNTKAVMPYISPDIPMDMPDLLKKMMADNKIIKCYNENCFWLDIGRPEDFNAAQKIFKESPNIFIDE